MEGTTLYYNGVLLRNVQTLSFEQSTEYDESRTDKIYDRFVLRVSGSVYPNADDQAHGTDVPRLVTGTGTAVDIMASVHRTLMQPRGEFRYEIGTEGLLTASPYHGRPDTDVNNGPKPLSCNITRVIGKQYFSVEFSIELCLALCDAGQASALYSLLSGPGRAGALENWNVLNNRWRVTEEIDQNLRRIRTLEGVLRVRHSVFYPHAFRHLCVPALARGFRRRSMVFTDTPDGLTLQYHVVDEERESAPPVPAVDWEATYSELSGMGGQMGWAEMSVKLVGLPGGDKQSLLAALEYVIESRINNARKSSGSQGTIQHDFIIEHMAIVEYLHEPIVQANVRARHVTNDPQSLFNARLAQIGKPIVAPGYDGKVWPRAGVWVDSSPYGMFAKYLQSPCWPVHGVPTHRAITQGGGSQSSEGGQQPGGDPGQDSQDGTKTLIFHGPETSVVGWDDQSNSQTAHRTSGHPYTYYAVELEYDLQDGVMQLPIARWGGSPNPGAAAPASAFIPIHAPIGGYTYVAHAERVGAWPEIPSAPPTGVDQNNIPMHRMRRRILPSAPEVLADGKSRLFKLQVRWDYRLASAPENHQTFGGGTSPLQVFSAAENAIDGSQVFGGSAS